MYGMEDSPVDFERLRAAILTHEGKRLKPYQDTTGHITIGYGRNLTDKGISNDEAYYLLSNDLKDAIAASEAEHWWPHVKGNDARARACIELVFNMGTGGVATFFHAIDALCRDDFNAAADAFMDSKWATQVGNRARIISEMIRTGHD